MRMEQIISVINYLNLGFLVMLLGLCAAQYARARRAVYGFYAAGALLYAVAGVCLLFPEWIVVGSLTPSVVEAVALFLFLIAFYQDEPHGGSQAFAVIAVVTMVFFNLVLFMGALNPHPPEFYQWIVLTLQLIFLLVPLIRLVSSPRAGAHYLAQAEIFLTLGVALTFVLLLAAPDVSPALAAVRGLAYAFGFFSLALYVVAAAAMPSETGLEEQTQRANLFEATSEMIDVFQRMEQAPGEDDAILRGVGKMAVVVRDRLGYRKIFFGQPAEQGRVRFSDCFPGASVLAASIELPPLITDDVVARRAPALVANAALDPRIFDRSLQQIGVNSFIVLPIVTAGAARGILLVGSRADGMPVGETDLHLFEFLTNHLSLLFSMLVVRGELIARDERDPVTLLRTYSSFQMALTEAIREADKSGRAFTLVFADVERFADVNEKCGYQRADEVLRDLGACLVKHSGAGVVGRVGADEFVYFIAEGSEATARAEIEKHLNALHADMPRICMDVPLGLSAAFSIYPFDFLEQSGVFGKMREMLAVGSGPGRITRVKCS